MPKESVVSEKDWDRAKRLTAKGYPGKAASKSDSFYAITTKIYKNIRKLLYIIAC